MSCFLQIWAKIVYFFAIFPKFPTNCFQQYAFLHLEKHQDGQLNVKHLIDHFVPRELVVDEKANMVFMHVSKGIFLTFLLKREAAIFNLSWYQCCYYILTKISCVFTSIFLFHRYCFYAEALAETKGSIKRVKGGSLHIFPMVRQFSNC